MFDWHRIAVCCAAGGEVSLGIAARDRVGSSAAYRPLPADPGASVYAHRMAYPHLARRDIVIECRRRLGVRRFTSDLPSDFGLRAILGRLPEPPDARGAS